MYMQVFSSWPLVTNMSLHNYFSKANPSSSSASYGNPTDTDSEAGECEFEVFISESDGGDFGPPPNKSIQCVKDVADYIGKTLSDSEKYQLLTNHFIPESSYKLFAAVDCSSDIPSDLVKRPLTNFVKV